MVDVKEEEPLSKKVKKKVGRKPLKPDQKKKKSNAKKVKLTEDADYDIKEENGGDNFDEDEEVSDDEDFVPAKTKNKDGSDRKPRAKEKKKRGRPRGKAADSKMNWMEAYYYFPQAGERDRSKMYHCDKCVRLFEKFYVSTNFQRKVLFFFI